MDPRSDDIVNEELQNDDLEQQHDDVEDNHEDHDQQHGSESATDNEPQHEENGDDDEAVDPKQEALDRAVAKQHAKYREEQRRRIAAEERLQQFESGSPDTDKEPEIVQVDPYADDVEELIKQRDESIRAHIAWQQRQQQKQQQRQSWQQQTEQQKQQEAAEQTEKFFANAKTDGIDQQKLNTAIQTVGQYQLGQEVAGYLLGDEKGHQVTLALAKSPALLADLALMAPHERILHIERNIRSKVANTKPRISQGKKPPTRVSGRAASASDRYPLTGGKVTVE